MTEPFQETIDLTDPTVLAYYSNFTSSIIELNDTLSPIRPLRRRRSQQPLQRLSSPIEILDSSRENIDENLPHQNNISNTSKKMNQLTESTQKEPNKECSPPAVNKIDCVICLETFGDQPIASTICGHVFCQDCLVEALRIEKKCPTCRHVLRGRHAYHQIFLNRE